MLGRDTGSPSRRGSGRGFYGRLLAGSDEPGDGLSHRYHSTHTCSYSRKDSVAGSFHLNHRFVGLDFEEGLAFEDALAFFFPPGEEFPGFLRHF
jgi:hypothetical protein